MSGDGPLDLRVQRAEEICAPGFQDSKAEENRARGSEEECCWVCCLKCSIFSHSAHSKWSINNCSACGESDASLMFMQSCIKFKKFKRSSIELTFNSSSKFLSFLSFMKEREGNFELELKVSSFELLVNFLNSIQL